MRRLALPVPRIGAWHPPGRSSTALSLWLDVTLLCSSLLFLSSSPKLPSAPPQLIMPGPPTEAPAQVNTGWQCLECKVIFPDQQQLFNHYNGHYSAVKPPTGWKRGDPVPPRQLAAFCAHMSHHNCSIFPKGDLTSAFGNNAIQCQECGFISGRKLGAHKNSRKCHFQAACILAAEQAANPSQPSSLTAPAFADGIAWLESFVDTTDATSLISTEAARLGGYLTVDTLPPHLQGRWNRCVKVPWQLFPDSGLKDNRAALLFILLPRLLLHRLPASFAAESMEQSPHKRLYDDIALRMEVFLNHSDRWKELYDSAVCHMDELAGQYTSSVQPQSVTPAVAAAAARDVCAGNCSRANARLNRGGIMDPDRAEVRATLPDVFPRSPSDQDPSTWSFKDAASGVYDQFHPSQNADSLERALEDFDPSQPTCAGETPLSESASDFNLAGEPMLQIDIDYAIEWLAKAPHGRAADDFGWRNELLQYLDDEASKLLASFLIELVQLGPESLPPVVVALMRFGRLVLLDKDPEHNAAALNDPSMPIKAPRPIGILSLFRRLAGGIAMSATRADMAAYFDIHGFQRGISRDGCNSLTQNFSAFLFNDLIDASGQPRPLADIAVDALHREIHTADAKAAFQTPYRPAMLDAIAEANPHLLPIARLFYGDSTFFHLAGATGDNAEIRIESDRGVTQGCPCGSTFFALVAHPPLLESVNRVRELDPNAVCAAIIDDVGFGVDGRRASLQQSIQLDSARGDERGGHRVLRYLTLQGHRLLQLPVHATNDSVRV